MSINHKTIKPDVMLSTYEALDATAKTKARFDVIAFELNARHKKIEAEQSSFNKNLRVKQAQRIINRLMRDVAYCEAFIAENHCQFLSDGTYVTYKIEDFHDAALCFDQCCMR